ncbi:GNAT family N-acetyltransferase [Cellulomonas sp. C5510]|uniref:GNAT family N-acetyltransferase n=1 Tax=Cellulomonas sp. C5510 TaxID=2871170 RepID=UPI002107B22C|nr:GNAT family protein [Cellulomonas sp. C5510]
MPTALQDLDWPVGTERLTLRPATASDAEAVWRYRRLPAVAEWMTALPGDLDRYAEQFAEPDRLRVTLVAEHEGVVVGDLMVRVEDAWAQTEVAGDAVATQAELGWAFDPAHHGRGLATEAAERVVDLCFAGLGLRRVTAGCFADNAPSWRLMERLGMRREAEFRAESLHRSGRWLDSYTYALLGEEWAAARA